MKCEQVSTTLALDPSQLLSDQLLAFLQLIEFHLTGTEGAVESGKLVDQLGLGRLR